MDLNFIDLHRCEEQLQQEVLLLEGIEEVYVETKSSVDITMKDFPHRQKEYQEAVAKGIPLTKINTNSTLEEQWEKESKQQSESQPLKFFQLSSPKFDIGNKKDKFLKEI